MNTTPPHAPYLKASSLRPGLRLFLIHWNKLEAGEYARFLTRKGFCVDVESSDGGRAVKVIRENPPHAVLVYMSRLPSRGRETATALMKNLKTHNIPLIFVDCKVGEAGRIKRVFPFAHLVSNSELVLFLSRMDMSA